MNSALIIGIILIIAGIALAVVAYMVITSSDEEHDEEEMEIVDEQLTAASDDPEAAVTAGEDQSDEEPERTKDPDVEISPSVEPALMDTPSEASLSDVDQVSEETVEPEIDEAPMLSTDRIQIATLLRDDVSGELIIKVGDQEYTSPEDLRASPDWTRIEYAASDLSRWIQTKVKETSPEKDAGTEVEGKVSEHKPSSMIEQINAILQEQIEATGRSELAVRLIEGPGGMARVLIGVHSYELTEVPDPEVQKLIREAVATWEATQ